MDVWKDKIAPRLKEIEQWTAAGVTDSGCCANLLIDPKTWRKYRKLKPALRDAIFRGRQQAVKQLRNALFDAAVGGMRTEERVYEVKAKDGSTKVHREVNKRYYPPNVYACNILLGNLDRDEWNNSSQRDENEAGEKQVSQRDKTDMDMHAIAKEIAQISISVDQKANDIKTHGTANTD